VRDDLGIEISAEKLFQKNISLAEIGRLIGLTNMTHNNNNNIESLGSYNTFSNKQEKYHEIYKRLEADSEFSLSEKELFKSILNENEEINKNKVNIYTPEKQQILLTGKKKKKKVL
jgi:hypothetical protein